MQKIKLFFQKETVLSISAMLAVLSMLWIHPNKSYFFYIDFRTLSLLFCLMAIVAGLKEIGVFDTLAEKILSRAKGVSGTAALLILLCFFFSMLITNDVALITFVPLTLITFKKLQKDFSDYWLLRVVVMQTIAANLGSMLTPIGNPQNLYLYAQANMSALSLIELMLPYSVASLIMLLIWVRLSAAHAPHLNISDHALELSEKSNAKYPEKSHIVEYLILFSACLFTVAHIIDYWIPLILVIIYSVFRNPALLRKIDYSLLLTFTALFIFIGNLKCIPQFNQFLSQILVSRETLTAILASQIMSNVPTAILLSGFTKNYTALIVGTNIGGLGTLIASMASLISFKYIAKDYPDLRKKYFVLFTFANFIFLIVLMLLSQFLT